eukprot:5199285-Prymnesium_polylepis.1
MDRHALHCDRHTLIDRNRAWSRCRRGSRRRDCRRFHETPRDLQGLVAQVRRCGLRRFRRCEGSL